MSAVESSPPSAPNTTHPTKPATPTSVSVAGWVLLVIAVGWLALIAYTGVSYATTHLSHFSTWRPVAGGCAGVLSGAFPDGQRSVM